MGATQLVDAAGRRRERRREGGKEEEGLGGGVKDVLGKLEKGEDCRGVRFVRDSAADEAG